MDPDGATGDLTALGEPKNNRNHGSYNMIPEKAECTYWGDTPSLFTHTYHKDTLVQWPDHNFLEPKVDASESNVFSFRAMPFWTKIEMRGGDHFRVILL